MKILMSILSSFFWRVRGGLRFKDKKLPANKIWYALFIGIVCYLKNKGLECSINATIATFVAYQLNSWGVYIGRLLLGQPINPELDKENPLIDEIILPLHLTWKGEKHYLYEYPKLYGFVGTTMTGAMITYLMGLGMVDFWFGFVGLGMGVCYWLGGQLNKLIPEEKAGWGYGEWIFGAYLGVML